MDDLLEKIKKTEEEANNIIQAAIDKTVANTGRGIFTSAMTTSVAFFTLMLNDFKGFSQFGFICGFGIISANLIFETFSFSLFLLTSSDIKALNPFPNLLLIIFLQTFYNFFIKYVLGSM